MGPCAPQTRRLYATMKIAQQLQIVSLLQRILIPAHNFGSRRRDKVDLDPDRTGFLNLSQIVVDFGACPHLFRIDPNDALYAFRLAVIDHLFQTLPLIFISLFPETPTVVDQVILPAQACSGIVPNLLLFKLRGLAAPPLPKHAARFHPVKIAGRIGRRAKIGQQVAVDQSVQIVCHDSRTPRGEQFPFDGPAFRTGRETDPDQVPFAHKAHIGKSPAVGFADSHITVAYNRRQRIDQCFACGNILKHRLLM